MIILLFYALNTALLLSCFLQYRKNFKDNSLSIALLQAIISLPLLAWEYFYFAYHLSSRTGELIFFSEAVFILTWLSLAKRMRHNKEAPTSPLTRVDLIEILTGLTFVILAGYILETQLLFIFTGNGIILPQYGAVYCLSILTLLIVLYSSWKIEELWRSMGRAERWRYKFLIAGSFLICGTLAWSTSYRLTYMVIYDNHLLLLSALLLLGWALMAYDFVTHRLLTKKIFISRKVVYSTLFPTLLAGYFILFGIVSLAMELFGLEMFFVVKWLLVAAGVVGVMLFSLSEKLRRRAHFFISTHFYANKYEYRDEWLKLSENLEGAQTEKEVVQALNTVLYESLYTTDIFIWLGDSEDSQDFTLYSGHKETSTLADKKIHFDDILVHYLEENPYFYIEAQEQPSGWKKVREKKSLLMKHLGLKLITPISIKNHLCGLIGIGSEYTGGEYSYDDFDLLSAIGSQTAAALLSIRISEKLANARELEAWNRLSAFVLHDIKNAATMLSLLQENAPDHIHEPEFQDDMLELVDDTLKRMKRVEERLGTLKEDLAPNMQPIELKTFLTECSKRMMKKISPLQIDIECPQELCINSDPELLHSIIENLLINASQAQDNTGIVLIKAQREANTNHASIKIQDNGSGIEESLLPDALFEPFKTTKDGGSGIGLWQVKKILSNMEGCIVAKNTPDGGAVFSIQLPLQ